MLAHIIFTKKHNTKQMSSSKQGEFKSEEERRRDEERREELERQKLSQGQTGILSGQQNLSEQKGLGGLKEYGKEEKSLLGQQSSTSSQQQSKSDKPIVQ
jgi:hypothetical protein